MITWGLSPRVRGNLHNRPLRHAIQGSIPARAGEPRRRGSEIATPSVYPRACGGTGGLGADLPFSIGLSPRVRGNRRRRSSACNRARSIPARAGEPAKGINSLIAARSIPARAGEPPGPIDHRKRDRVYPRACGGTCTWLFGMIILLGLSPRVRGNLELVGASGNADGSIPARAGEPQWASCPRGTRAVYPRACGGTALYQVGAITSRGLSPRVRGNLLTERVMDFPIGSIPARAGEPAVLGVHLPALEGLSPRVRGNPCETMLAENAYRSIPARAGEPGSAR